MSTQKLQSDVTVVGASLSGSVLAYLLGAKGYSVTLVDPQSFPRQKACGEGLSAIGYSYLKALGLWSRELEESASPFFGYKLNCANGLQLSLESKRSKPAPQGFGISRLQLDAHVFSAAMLLPRVTNLHDTVVSKVKTESGWSVSTSGGWEIQSDHLVLASGGGAIKLMPELKYREAPRKRFGLAFWCDGVWSRIPTTVQIYQRSEGQYIITPISKSKVNVSILLNKSRAKVLSSSEIQKCALEIVAEAGFKPTDVSDVRGASAIHSAVLAGEPPDLFVIGDAVERMDPIGGMGMTHAFYSACLAYETIVDNKDVHYYYSKRARGVRALRFLTRLSYALNVQNSKILTLLTKQSPQVSFAVNTFIKKCFSKPFVKCELPAAKIKAVESVSPSPIKLEEFVL